MTDPHKPSRRPAAGKATAKTGAKGWLSRELTALAVVAFYFGCWIAVAIGMKSLVLAEHHITFAGWSAIVIGALVLSKVVLVLEHVSLGAWQRSAPAWVDVAVRTVLYSLGVVVVLVLEKGFEGRSEHGGFVAALQAAFDGVNAFHFYTNAICITGALLVYNIFSVIRSHLGNRGLLKMFLQPLPTGERTA